MKKILFAFACLLATNAYAQPQTGRSGPLPPPSEHSPSPPSNNAAPTHALGNTFVDATDLVDQIKADNYDEIIRILYFYASPNHRSDQAIDFTPIEEMLKRNTFLNELLRDKIQALRDHYRLRETAIDQLINAAPREASGINGVGLSSLFPARRVADGLGSFLAERFKEELTQRYLQAFRDSLMAKNNKLYFSVLLPKTYMSLVNYENVFDYKSFMTALKEAFKDDLDNVAGNSLKFVDTLKHTGHLPIRDDAMYYLIHYVADFAINELPDGTSPAMLFENIEAYKYREKINPDIRAAVRITGLFSSNLRNNLGTELRVAEINALFRNPLVLLAFSGLTIEKERLTLENEIRIANMSAYQWLNGQTTIEVAPLIRSIGALRQQAELFVSSERKLSDAINLASSVTPEVRNLLVSARVLPRAQADSIFGTIDHVINLAYYAVEQKYGLAVTESLELFADFSLEKTPFYLNYKKYGLFISNVAQAETSDQVKEALQIAALPVGSYKIKRNALSDISLNAFPGGFGGIEYRNNIPTDIESTFDISNTSGSLGFTAPVGLAFSWGSRKTKEDGSTTTYANEYEVTTTRDGQAITEIRYVSGVSHSVFLSIIDIGAITSFRLVDDDTETLPEFDWNNILAPAAYYVLGLRNTPMSLGVGVQYGPQLRGIDGTDATLSDSMLSARAFLTVDVPIFSFFSRTTPKRSNSSDKENKKK